MKDVRQDQWNGAVDAFLYRTVRLSKENGDLFDHIGGKGRSYGIN